MPQDRETGAAGDAFGRLTAPKIADMIGAKMTRPGSNEANFQAKRIVIKCAGSRTSSVGVSLQMLSTLDAVLAAFQRDDGRFDLLCLDAKSYARHMTPTKSKGPSAGKVGIVEKKIFLTEGAGVLAEGEPSWRRPPQEGPDTNDTEQIAPIFDPFEVKDRKGNIVRVNCSRHQGSCWRLLFSSTEGEELGDLLFEPNDQSTVKLINFHVFPEYARKGIGTAVLLEFLKLLRNNSFKAVNGSCVSYERPLSEKKKLALWYESFGFTLVPESLAAQPGYMGKLNLVL